MEPEQSIPPSCCCAAEHFTEREIQVLRLVAAGLSNRKIAQLLNVSSHTVDRHVSAMLRRSEVPNRASLVDVAYASQILIGGASPPRASGRRCIRVRETDVPIAR